jgi:hypothetical protein
MDSFTKQPSEALDYDIDLTEWATTGDTVTKTEVSVDSSVYAGSYASTGIDISISNDTTFIPKLWVSNGVDGTVYLVSVQITTSEGRLKEVDFKMKIKEIN